MKKIAIAGCLLLCSTAAIAQAKIEFAQYEGPDVVETGTGGTKITKNGIDYWTSGTPPRRYQVIGRISDRRDEEWDGGQALGSPKVAKVTKKAGGNAVVILEQTETGKGSTGFGSLANGIGSWFTAGSSKTTTVMLVVRYLD